MVTTFDKPTGADCPLHSTTLPSAVRARLRNPPPAIATTLLKPGGTLVWPEELDPQASTVPSALSARLWKLPAAMDTTVAKPAGTLVWPDELSPHAATFPLLLKTKL